MAPYQVWQHLASAVSVYATHGSLQERNLAMLKKLGVLSEGDFLDADERAMFGRLIARAKDDLASTQSDDEALEIADMIIVLAERLAIFAFQDAARKSPTTSI